MLDIIAMHKMFHNYHGFKRPNEPTFINTPHMKMRLNFLLEELQELAAASGFTAEMSDDFELRYVKDGDAEENFEEILDAIIDIQVVLLGTADFLGLLNTAKKTQVPQKDGSSILVDNDLEPFTIFEEAYNRVWQANMKKEAVSAASESKRGFNIDLKKPAGWVKPDLKDLVTYDI